MEKFSFKNTMLYAILFSGSAEYESLRFAWKENISFKVRIAAAFAKTFPASGYDHNLREYYGDFKKYCNHQDVIVNLDADDDVEKDDENESSDLNNTPSSLNNKTVQEQNNPENKTEKHPYDNFDDFVKNPKLSNPAVSFFGATGLKGGWQVLYAVKVPLVTLFNVIRLATEFLLYVGESAFCHLLVKSKLKWNEVSDENSERSKASRVGSKILIGLAMAALLLMYYLFKAARLAVRLVTVPVESATTAWKAHPILGILSAAASIAAYTALLLVALPAAAMKLAPLIIDKVVSLQTATIVIKAVTDAAAAVSSLFSGALPILTALATALIIAIKKAYDGIRNYVKNKDHEEKVTNNNVGFFKKPSPVVSDSEEKSDAVPSIN